MCSRPNRRPRGCKLCGSETGEVGAARLGADRETDVADLLGTSSSLWSTSQVFRILPRRGRTAGTPGPAPLGRAAGGIAFHQKDLAALGVSAAAVGKLAGQDGPLVIFFRMTTLPLLTGAGRQEWRARQSDRSIGVLVEPEGERVLDTPAHEGGTLAGAEAFLGLAGELGLLHLDGEHVVEPVPHVVGDSFNPLGRRFRNSQ